MRYFITGHVCSHKDFIKSACDLSAFPPRTLKKTCFYATLIVNCRFFIGWSGHSPTDGSWIMVCTL